ncbi:HTH-type transcriptional repressor NicS [Arthrobacter sp. Hiyo8]|uniref:TetR/AcrR family transcriptional regulator n=1 Tax=Arthrobacter sp. Hiyo1 TaxID=1588020 RepID=UPI000683AB69|nr:TetR family transcriptional regulator [Arthrobacter sp. Hiyo1]BAS11940.1 HTH-type transcriptional repressor NicS [Arthrobacter sp. Hiyo8]GAP61433.1 HTH-type transcriptional repressor NicS [Arthrobacter sp. Hiyo1]
MAWDIERTKALLLTAAAVEFSKKGLAGARVDNIASGAGISKERIYQYFGNKEGLFDAVLAAELGSAMDEVPIVGCGPTAMGEFAGRLFEHRTKEDAVSRLLFWEGLERGDQVADRAARAGTWGSKVDEMLKVLPGISRTDAADLLLTVLTLCGGWHVLPQVDALLVSDRHDRPSRRKAFVVRVMTIAAEALLADASRP